MKEAFERNIVFFLGIDHGSLKHVKECIDAGVNVNLPSEHGEIPLRKAVLGQDLELAQMLIEAGADVNAQNQWGRTLLHDVAGCEGPVAIARWLLYAGADLNAQDEEGLTPLHKGNHSDFGCMTPEKVRAFIEAGADVNARDFQGRTPVFMLYKTVSECGEIVEILLDAGAELEARDHSGMTPLLKMADGASPSEMAVLIKAGADVNAQDPFGKTALHFVANNYTRVRECMKLLLDAEADVTIRDGKGFTAADYVEKEWGYEDQMRHKEVFLKLGVTFPPKPRKKKKKKKKK